MSLLGAVTLIKGQLPSPIRSLVERIEASQLGKRLAHGAFWSLVGTLVYRGLNMAAMILLARILGKVEFGEVGVIQSTMGMVQTLAGFGLGWAATKYVAEFRKSDPARAGRIISFSNLVATGTGGVMALLFYGFAPWLAQHSLAAPHLARPLQVSSLVLFVGTLAGTQNGILAGFEAFRSIARISLISGIVSVPLIVGGAMLLGVEGAVWGMIAANAVNWILNYQNLRRAVAEAGIQLSRKGCWKERRLLWNCSLPTILGGTAYNIATWIGSVMLVNRPGGYGEMGSYNAANQWFAALLFLPGVLGQAAIPVLSEQIGKNDFDRARKILTYSLKMNAAIILPVLILGSLCSPWIMSLYGKGFDTAWATLVLTLIAASLAAMQAPPGQILFASGNMWLCSIMNFGWSLAFVLLAYLFVSTGSLGLALSRSLAYVIYSGLSLMFCMRFLKAKLL